MQTGWTRLTRYILAANLEPAIEPVQHLVDLVNPV